MCIKYQPKLKMKVHTLGKKKGPSILRSELMNFFMKFLVKMILVMIRLSPSKNGFNLEVGEDDHLIFHQLEKEHIYQIF